MAMTTGKLSAQICYFDSEGRHNLEELLRVVKRVIKSREELHSLKLVIFTSEGQGPALAYNKLSEFGIKMIAVTFPRTYTLRLKNGSLYRPQISSNVIRFFNAVGIEVLTPPSLPFDFIDGLDGHNQQMKLINQTLAMFGSGFGLCIQAILRACDQGLIEEGESVMAMSGDVAGLFTASTTRQFLNTANGVSVQEIFCKPRKLTISRRKSVADETRIIEGIATRLEPPPST